MRNTQLLLLQKLHYNLGVAVCYDNALSIFNKGRSLQWDDTRTLENILCKLSKIYVRSKKAIILL